MEMISWENSRFVLKDTGISSAPLYIKGDEFVPTADDMFCLRSIPEVTLKVVIGSNTEKICFILENQTNHEILLNLFPPFAEMCVSDPLQYDSDTLFVSSCQDRDRTDYSVSKACIGGIGEMTAHIPQDIFRDSMYYTMPCQEGFLNILLKANGCFTFQPGEKREMRCFLYTGQGDRNDALEDMFRKKICYEYAPEEYDDSLYRQLSWVPDITCAFMNWAWDRGVMDPQTGAYTLYSSLKKWTQKIGKIDIYVLWPFWPRAGFDERDQFDHYRCFPGGLTGLRDEIHKVQSLGIRVILAYCFWSEADRAGSETEEKALMDRSFRNLLKIGEELDCDGFDMDCMSEIPEALWELSRKNQKDYLPYNEGDPGYEKSQTNLLGRLHDSSVMTAFNLKRYILPHHPMLRVTGPGLFGKRMRNEIVLSFFNGHGIEFNLMFGTNDVNCKNDWEIWKKAHQILDGHRSCFLSRQWKPFIKSLDPRIWINQWPGKDMCLYTICSTIPEGFTGDLLSLPDSDRTHYIDLFALKEAELRHDGSQIILAAHIDGYEAGQGVEIGTADYTAGCIAAYPRLLTLSNFMEKLSVDIDDCREGDWVELILGRDWGDTRKRFRLETKGSRCRLDIDLYKEFGFTNEAVTVILRDKQDQIRDIGILPAETVRLFAISRCNKTSYAANNREGMVLIPEGEYQYSVHHSQPIWFNTYINLSPNNDDLYHTCAPSKPVAVHLPSFYMDAYPVTNQEYLKFVKETGYHGGDTAYEQEGFLHHLPGLVLPDELADKPVTFVSYQDACAYCRWAGKRLPTEQEWQYAAGGADGRLYPWGNDSDPQFYNDTGALSDVDAYPSGASPYGVYDLVGNVYQWTDAVVTNGSHEMVYLRGGSFYTAPNGKNARWWIAGGLNRINDHHPLPLFGPRMNRLSTVGFRCAADR